MAELGDLTPPVVGARTRLHGHRTGRERGQEREELAAAQLLAKDHRARAVSPMELKDVFGEIEADGAHLVHGRLLEWALTPPLWHADAAGGRPHHHAPCESRNPLEGGVRGAVRRLEPASGLAGTRLQATGRNVDRRECWTVVRKGRVQPAHHDQEPRPRWTRSRPSV